MKIGAEKKVVSNMNGVPNAAYVNNQSRTYQSQPYRVQQPMGNVSGQHVQQGNPQMQYQQMAGNTQQRYQQMPNINTAQYQQPQYQQMLNTNQNQQMQANTQSTEQVLTLAEELKKYKELVDAGIITEQEYEEKKKKLLGL